MIRILRLFAQNRAFRCFLIFSVFNNIGEGIFGIFMMWAVHFSYQNPFYTGIAGAMLAVSNAANFLVGPFVDRRNKVSVIRGATFLRLCIVGLLLLVSHFFVPEVWFFFIVMLVFNTTTMFCAPAISAYMPRIVDNGEDLVKANAFVSIAGMTAGLGVGVLLYFALAETGGAAFEIAYTVNTAMFLLAVIFSVFLKSAEPRSIEKSAAAPLRAYFSELKEGLLFIRQGVVFVLVLTFLITSAFANFAYVNLPMFAQHHTGHAQGYIILSALTMVGGIIGSYIFRMIGHRFEAWKVLVLGFITAGAVRIIFVNVIDDSFTRSLWIAALYVGIGSMVGMMFGTLMQRLPRKNILARVGALNTSLMGAMTALGSFLGGIAGTHLPDVDMIFIIHGISYIAVGLCLCLSKKIRGIPKIGEIADTPNA